MAEACTPEEIFGATDLRCLAALDEDSVINDPSAEFGPLDPDFERPLLDEFASGPLRFTTRPIDLPEPAAPLGYRLFTPSPVLLRPFTRAELPCATGHAGYVGAVRRAVVELIARGLYDRRTGAMDERTARRSDVLR